MTITLDAIKAEHSRIAEMIEQFERQPEPTMFPINIQFPALNKEEKFIGIIISADGAKREHIILLPGEFKGNWADSMAWAESIGGELFDRTEGALLFATMKSEFKEEWHWTREQHATDSGSAWYQYVYDGVQFSTHKSYEGRARAVRRSLIIQ